MKANNWKLIPGVGGLSADWYRWGDLKVCVAQEMGMWHVSISHPSRYPTWEEIKAAWYDLVPEADKITGGILLPRKSEYVNVHKNCFHVHQLTEEEISHLTACANLILKSY